jgi:diguanylate cyclase (GGDEF)-like protein
MELLVSDSSQAVLQRAAEHPSAGAPGCDVDSPFHCQAVRRGNSVTFLDSNALCACPHLRGRPGALEAISAVCVPLHFMGRALGVLHTTGPAQQPIQPHQLTQLATIGAQAASRIGVVRAFERTQLQAATDAATGLANRRALEAAIAELLGKKRHFALVMADLDRFKMLNDTYGHLVGDDALRLFADTMKKSVRDLDTVARWGGEEFAILLPGCNAREGADWAARARAALAMALASAKVPKFTVSLGIADSTMAERMDDLLRIADEALYRSKEQGRDRATIGRALAANEFSTRQRSEHEERIDVTRLNDVSVA